MSGITLIAQIFIHCLSVLTNTFGIYCLRRQRKHRRHHTEGHSLLMQNLACIEIIKMPMVVFHYHEAWYRTYYKYFELAEGASMTIFFNAFLLILLDKIALVVFPVKRQCFSARRIKRIIAASWVVGLVLAPITWFVPLKSQVGFFIYTLFFESTSNFHLYGGV